MDIGVGMADHAHAYVLSDLAALQVGDHGVPKTMETLTRHLVLAPLGIARVYPSLGHYADKGMAKAAVTSTKSFGVVTVCWSRRRRPFKPAPFR